MRLIATLIGTTPSDILTIKTSTINKRRMYKTEIDLDVARPLLQDALRLAHKDSIPALASEQTSDVRVVSPIESTVISVVSRSTDPAGDAHSDSRVKVETKSIGKISALITRFNGVESAVLDPKLPAKQFRIDLRNVTKTHDTASDKSSASPSGQGDEDISILVSQSSRLPVVHLNGKMYTETAKQEDVTFNSNMSTGRKELCMLKIPPKPKPKPKDTKKSIYQTAYTCAPNNQQSVVHCARPSNLQLVTPFAIHDVPGTNNSGTVSKTSECENGRHIHIKAGVSACGSNPSAHTLSQTQITDTASNYVMLSKDSRNNYIYRDYERLSTEQPGVENLIGSLTDSSQEGQQKTTVMKHTVLPRHVGINKISQVDSKGKLFTNDVILESVVTLDIETVSNTKKFGRIESKAAVSSVSRDISCHEHLVKVTEECRQLRRSNEKTDVVISEEKVCDTVKNDKENPSKSNGAENVIKLGESRNENMTRNVILVLDCNDPKTTDLSVVCCKTSTDPSVVGCKTSTDPNVVGSKTSTDPRVHDCTIFKESSDYGCTASTDSGVFGCTASTESSLDGCPTSTELTVEERKTSVESSIDGCPISTELIVDERKASVESSLDGCPTSTELIVEERKTSVKSSIDGCLTSTELIVEERKTSVKSSIDGCPTSTELIVDERKTPVESSIDGCPTSTELIVDERKTPVESSVDGCPTSTELIIDERKTPVESSVDGCTSAVSGSGTSTGSSVDGCTSAVSGSGTSTGSILAECSQDGPGGRGDTITAKLDMLKSELMAMRKMDLVLLRQLINISQAIQHIHRSDLPKISRSLTFLSSKKNLQPRLRAVERQNSAPHCADRRRFLFSNVRWNTEDDYRDSLSSFDESEFDSQSELEESTSSLNNATTSLSRSGAGRRILFQSRNIPLSLDISEDSNQSYEDILQRNVRLWKMFFQRHQSVQEKVDVWF